MELIELAARRSGVTDADAKATAEAAMEMIAVQYGGRRLYIPQHELANRARRDSILADLASGKQVTEIARRHQISPQRVKEIRRTARAVA